MWVVSYISSIMFGKIKYAVIRIGTSEYFLVFIFNYLGVWKLVMKAICIKQNENHQAE